MGDNDFRDVLPDPDPEQTLEWKEAIRAVSDALGPERPQTSIANNWGSKKGGHWNRCCQHPLSQYYSSIRTTLLSRRFRNGEKNPWNHFVERNDDGNACK